VCSLSSVVWMLCDVSDRLTSVVVCFGVMDMCGCVCWGDVYVWLSVL